jgi:hypothetical protein
MESATYSTPVGKELSAVGMSAGNLSESNHKTDPIRQEGFTALQSAFNFRAKHQTACLYAAFFMRFTCFTDLLPISLQHRKLQIVY